MVLLDFATKQRTSVEELAQRPESAPQDAKEYETISFEPAIIVENQKRKAQAVEDLVGQYVKETANQFLRRTAQKIGNENRADSDVVEEKIHTMRSLRKPKEVGAFLSEHLYIRHVIAGAGINGSRYQELPKIIFQSGLHPDEQVASSIGVPPGIALELMLQNPDKEISLPSFMSDKRFDFNYGLVSAMDTFTHIDYGRFWDELRKGSFKDVYSGIKKVKDLSSGLAEVIADMATHPIKAAVDTATGTRYIIRYLRSGAIADGKSIEKVLEDYLRHLTHKDTPNLYVVTKNNKHGYIVFSAERNPDEPLSHVTRRAIAYPQGIPNVKEDDKSRTWDAGNGEENLPLGFGSARKADLTIISAAGVWEFGETGRVANYFSNEKHKIDETNVYGMLKHGHPLGAFFGIMLNGHIKKQLYSHDVTIDECKRMVRSGASTAARQLVTLLHPNYSPPHVIHESNFALKPYTLPSQHLN